VSLSEGGPSRPDRSRRGKAAGLLAWLVASCVLLFPLTTWFRPVSLAETPLDETNPVLARQWRFLLVAAPQVPPGASFTPIAQDAQKETSLFFLSLGLIPDGRALPSSYWNKPTPSQGALAEYLLVFGLPPAKAPGNDIVAIVPDGCVLKRRKAAP